MLEVLYASAAAAQTLLALAVAALIVTMIRGSRRTPRGGPIPTPPAQEVPEIVDTPETAPQAMAAPTQTRESPVTDRALTPPPMIQGVTLREWMFYHHPLKDGVWASAVAEFYSRAAARPEIADYFGAVLARPDGMNDLQRHFTRALAIVAGSGLSAGTLEALRRRHGHVVNTDGRPITREVYDATIGIMVDILTEQGVPREGIDSLARTIAPLRDVIARA